MMSPTLHVTTGAPLDERSELVLELAHICGQLHACSNPETAHPLIEELAEVAGQLSVPKDERRADCEVFLAEPEGIGAATWAQCGGVLYALSQSCPDNRLQIASRVAQRLMQLAARPETP